MVRQQSASCDRLLRSERVPRGQWKAACQLYPASERVESEWLKQSTPALSDLPIWFCERGTYRRRKSKMFWSRKGCDSPVSRNGDAIRRQQCSVSRTLIVSLKTIKVQRNKHRCAWTNTVVHFVKVPLVQRNSYSKEVWRGSGISLTVQRIRACTAAVDLKNTHWVPPEQL